MELILNSRQTDGPKRTTPFIASCSYSGETSTIRERAKAPFGHPEAPRDPMVCTGNSLADLVKITIFGEQQEALDPAGRFAMSPEDGLVSRIAIQNC